MTTVHWRSEADDDVPVLLRHSRADEVCAMFHTPIPEVLVDGVGTFWTEHVHDASDADTANDAHTAAQLPCGHVFNACALATHFCTNDMRCPVCRRGPALPARLESMAVPMQPALRKRRDDIIVATTIADDDAFVFHEPTLDRDFVFTARLHSAVPRDAVARCVVIQTPVRLNNAPHAPHDPHDLHDQPLQEHLDAYSTHRSFQRLFNLHLREATARENCVVFSIAHPLLPDGLRSAALSARDLALLADMRVRIPLSRDMGFVVPSHCDTGMRLAVYLNTAYITMVCVQAAIDWQHYLQL